MLMDSFEDARRSAAGALTMLYRNGMLSDSQRQLILSQRDRRARSHADSHTDNECVSLHDDLPSRVVI